MTVAVHCESGGLITSQARASNLLVAIPRPCSPAPENFKLDGDISEWRSREPARIASKGQIVWQTDELISQLTSLWTGPDDLSAEVWYAWDTRRLLVALDVQDNDVQVLTDPPGREYQGDCVELFLDGRTDTTSTNYSKGVYQMLWTPPTNIGDIGRFAKARDASGVEAMGRRTPTGHTVELSVPFTGQNFPGFVGESGAIFGFNIALDDLDSGKGVTSKIQMALNGIGRNHVDTSSFTRLRFEVNVARKNVIANGDFEATRPSVPPAHWEMRNGDIVEEGIADGQCLKLRKSGDAGATATQMVHMEPDKCYVLSFGYRTQGKVGVSYIKLDKYLGNIAVVPSDVYPIDSSNSQTWSLGLMHLYSGKGGKAEIEIRLHSRAMEIAVGDPQDVSGIDNFAILSGARRLEPGREYLLTFKGS